MSINGTTMAGTGIAYSANMLVFVSEYQDDVLIDTFSSTVPFSLPPTNSTSTFEQIGKDSIHYTGTNMLGSVDQEVQRPPEPNLLLREIS